MPKVKVTAKIHRGKGKVYKGKKPISGKMKLLGGGKTPLQKLLDKKR